MSPDLVSELRLQHFLQKGAEGSATYLSDLALRAADEIEKLRLDLARESGTKTGA